MKAKVIKQMQPQHLAEKSFVYITYGAAEYDIFITKIIHSPFGDEIEFIGDSALKMPLGAEFFIGKKNDKKIKMEVI